MAGTITGMVSGFPNAKAFRELMSCSGRTIADKFNRFRNFIAPNCEKKFL